jgi:4-diphosphocytidyl-2-C-methyl-D-erythritol kinase
MILHETAFAKLNLALHVRAKRSDDYHLLETLFAFVEDGDTLSIAAADEISLTIAGPFGAGLSNGEDNLVVRAARALAEAYGVETGAALHLEKNLPIASGIGGGSADAAAALRLLTRFWSLDSDDPKLLEIAATLGADVPACVHSRTVVGTGVGDVLAPFAGGALSGRAVLLINPLRPCPTGAVFANWDQIDRGALDPLDLEHSRNDLTASAVSLVPEIAQVLDALVGACNADLIRMSGSGATCFALFETSEAMRSAATVIAAAYPNWWQLGSRIR